MELRQYAWVKFNYEGFPEEFRKEYYNRFGDRHFIYLGEIPNQKGHCIVMDTEGKMHFPYHIEDWIECPEEELCVTFTIPLDYDGEEEEE